MRTRGFTLIEVVLALALTSLVVAGVSTGLLLADRTIAQLADTVKARQMLDECGAVVRWMRDAEGLDSLGAGTYGLVLGDTWTMTAGPDSDGEHERTVTITETNADTRTVECVVAWQGTTTAASSSVVTMIGR